MRHPFDDPDAPVSPEEKIEAEALARALDGRGDTGRPVNPEMETAALLRQAASEATPDVRARVRVRPRPRWWLWPTLLVPAAAGVLLVGGGLMTERRSAPTVTPLAQVARPAPSPAAPLPSPALLRAQASAAHGDRRALSLLELEMRRYRASYYRGEDLARVDRLLTTGDPIGAARELEAMAQRLRADGAPSTTAGRRALRDIAFRLGQLRLDSKDYAATLQECERGLELGSDDDIFTANLLILRGLLRQERYHPSEAAEDFRRALLMTEKLQQLTQRDPHP